MPVGAREKLKNPYDYGSSEWVDWQSGKRPQAPMATATAEPAAVTATAAPSTETGPWTSLNITKEQFESDWRYKDWQPPVEASAESNPLSLYNTEPAPQTNSSRG